MSKHTMTEEYQPILDQIRALPCRCCMQKTLHTFVQEALRPGGREIVYVHCMNPDCALYYVTRAFKDWVKFDLGEWKAAEHPDWAAQLTPPPQSLTALVENFIVEREAPVADLVLRDFREQLRATLPYRRRALAESWLHIYTGVS